MELLVYSHANISIVYIKLLIEDFGNEPYPLGKKICNMDKLNIQLRNKLVWLQLYFMKSCGKVFLNPAK